MDKMACMWVTEYVANTAFVVYKRAGKIVYPFTEDTVSKLTVIFMFLDCLLEVEVFISVSC